MICKKDDMQKNWYILANIIIITGLLNSIRDYVFILQKSILWKSGIKASKQRF